MIGAVVVFYWIYDYPTKYIGVLFAFVFVALTWSGIFIFRSIVRSWIHGERSANDMVGFTLSSFSVLYGLLLGLLAVASYQNFSGLSDIVDKEDRPQAYVFYLRGVPRDGPTI
jgi:hypothetical protein